MKAENAEIYGQTEESRTRAAFWRRHGPTLDGKAYQLRRDILSGYGPEKCRAGWFVEWHEGFGFICRHKEAGRPSFRPNLNLLRLSDLSLYVPADRRPGFQLGLAFE